MTKSTHANVLDAPLDHLSTNGDILVLLDAHSATYAAANTGGANNLATHALTGGDYTKAAGDVSGRKTTVAAQNTVEVLVTGTAINVGILDSGNSVILHQTECTSQAVTDGNDVNFPAWDIEFNDPT